MPPPDRTPDLQLAHERMIEELRDLVSALDRCISLADPETGREFACDAAALRHTALTWLQTLRDARGTGARRDDGAGRQPRFVPES